jgi:hypothetical protein
MRNEILGALAELALCHYRSPIGDRFLAYLECVASRTALQLKGI